MIVLIESVQGKITLDVSFAGWMGASQSNWKSQTYDIRFTSKEGLSVILPQVSGELVLPIGSVEFVKKACEILDIELPKPLNIPTSLESGLGRRIWSCKRSEINSIWYPFFVKPEVELKLFTGFVANSEADFELYPELNGWNGSLLCSEPLGYIESEWRCYILGGKVLNCSCYNGDALCFPDRNKIEDLIAGYKDAPTGYALDVAVTGDGTQLIECNDAWALGYYGGEFEQYFKMVRTRWMEILRAQKVV